MDTTAKMKNRHLSINILNMYNENVLQIGIKTANINI